jgi:hypothetical protein
MRTEKLVRKADVRERYNHKVERYEAQDSVHAEGNSSTASRRTMRRGFSYKGGFYTSELLQVDL